jgi:HTH-type transcriptional regulator / antitoxin HipB
MSDLIKYISKRKENDTDFNNNFERGYEEFKIGIMLKELRIREGLTQEELANKLNTKKSVISRMENHAEDIRLSTIEKVAAVYGKRLQISIE